MPDRPRRRHPRPRPGGPREPHARLPRGERIEDVGLLRPIDPHRDGTLPAVLEATRILRRELGDRVYILAEADQGPSSLAAQIVGIEEFLMAIMEPDRARLVEALLAYTTDQVTRCALALLDAGAHLTMMGESIAAPDVCAPDQYRSLALPWERRVVEAVAAGGRPLRILALGAHADDLEILAGGTLARLSDAGHHLTLATMTWCRFGSYELEPEACSAARHAEAARSAALLGAEYRALMVPDDTVNPYDETQQRLVMELVRSVRPDVILTHSPADYHTDHTNLFELVRWTGPLLGMPRYRTPSPHLDALPALYVMDTLNGRGFEPTRYVDISGHLERKLALIACFESQLPFLERYFGIDVLEQAAAVARFRGLQAGVRHAEGFQRWMTAGWGNLTADALP